MIICIWIPLHCSATIGRKREPNLESEEMCSHVLQPSNKILQLLQIVLLYISYFY